MKIINATWEKRNLGVPVIEITLCTEDLKKTEDILKSEIYQAIADNEAKYSVLKMPVGDFAVLKKIQNIGFNFVETQFSINGSLNPAANVAASPIFNRKGICCKKDSSPSMFDLVCSHVETGIFGTDRIALDPKFGIDIANKRYANWIKDIEKKENRDLRTVFYNDSFVGFLLGVGNRENKSISFPLGGVIPKYQSAFGALVYGLCFKSFAEDYKTAETSFSSNNPVIVNLYSYFGFSFSSFNYVFIRHEEN